jgi:hypothetical protein
LVSDIPAGDGKIDNFFYSVVFSILLLGICIPFKFVFRFGTYTYDLVHSAQRSFELQLQFERKIPQTLAITERKACLMSKATRKDLCYLFGSG